MKIVKIYLVAFLAISLASCGLLTTKDGSENTYVLSAVDLKDSKSNKGVLSVAKPLMASGLNTQRIALIHDDIKVDYYATAKWSDNLGAMVQDRLIESIQKAHIFSTTVSDKVSLNPQYFLVTDIRRFQAEYGEKDEKGKDKAPIAHVSIDVKLVNASNRAVVRQFTSSSQVQANDNQLSAIAKALDKAFRNVQTEIVEKLR